MTPGKACASSLRERVGQRLLGDAARPLVERLERREQLDVVEAGDVGAVVGAPELRDDRDDLRVRAVREVAVLGVLRQPRITARMWPTYFADCSSEIDIGSVARIQKLPSSSLGMNSPPQRRAGAQAGQHHHRAEHDRRAFVPQREGEERQVEPLERAHEPVVGLVLVGIQDGEAASLAGRPQGPVGDLEDPLGQDRRQRERQDDRAADREGVGVRHRREDHARHARHREERQERDADDQRREEHRRRRPRWPPAGSARSCSVSRARRGGGRCSPS